MADISQQLIEQIDTARAEGRKLNIVGRGSKTFLGREAVGDPIGIAEHSGVVDYQPVELVMTVRAGTTVADIEAVLDEQGQMLSFEPPGFGGHASIGGTLACNLSGPARPWGGSVRDMVLGLRLINGHSEHLRFGGQVMKNVAGYDVTRLQAGAMGTLGVITEISLKVLPKPATTLTLVQSMDAQEAILTMSRMAGKAKPVTAACWLNNKFYLRLAGAGSAVDGAAAQLLSDRTGSAEVLENADQFWHSLREQQLPFFAGDAPLWRFSLKSSADHFLPEANWLIDWGGAQRWLRVDGLPDDCNQHGGHDQSALEKMATTANGQTALFRGGDRRGDVFHSQPDALKVIHKRLKSSFDPDGLFNPGRLYSWL